MDFDDLGGTSTLKVTTTTMSEPMMEQNATYEAIDSQSEEEEPYSKQTKGKRKRSSWVWEHFTIKEEEVVEVEEKNEESRKKRKINVKSKPKGQVKKKALFGTCKYCKTARYNADSRCGTSNFTRHLEICLEYKKHNSCEGSDKVIDQNVIASANSFSTESIHLPSSGKKNMFMLDSCKHN